MKPKNSKHREAPERRKAKEMADTKSENSKLRREVARLQREIDRLEFVGSVDNEDDPIEVKPVKRKQGSCQECGEMSLKELVTPTKTILVCTTCKTRQTS